MKWQILWFIIAIGCVLYGFLILSLRSGTSFFAVWMGLGGFFFLLAAAAHVHLWQKFPAGVKVTFLTAAAVCLICLVWIMAVIFGGFRKTGERNLDYLIVLGAQVRENGPSVVLQYRLDTACRYLEENPDTLCIVSGGKGWNEPFPEAEGMRDYLLQEGIAEDRILMEAESHNTWENIQNSMQMLDPGTDTVGIVTNNFHLFRSCAVAKKAGIRNVCGIAAPSKLLYLPNNMLREVFGVIKDTVKKNI